MPLRQRKEIQEMLRGIDFACHSEVETHQMPFTRLPENDYSFRGNSLRKLGDFFKFSVDYRFVGGYA